ncbi:MAG TPA: glycine cleavage system protein GcvH [Ilumatobacteraceae bacterium]|nr:glycine cleavage system protein GcvH [Ilumatobacteraceae bacterium]
MNIPAELRYSSDHEWVKVDGDTATIGITEYAQDALGDVVFVEMPEPGRAVTVGDSFSEVESTKSVSDIYAPVSGTISAVNDALESQPELLNSDPYGAGWICRITLADVAELDSLMDAEAYRTLTEG